MADGNFRELVSTIHAKIDVHGERNIFSLPTYSFKRYIIPS